MVSKLTLQDIINKYYLGENESVKWVVKDKELTIDFMSQNKDVLGKITASNVKMEDNTLPIFHTKKLLNLLNITHGDLLLEIEKTNKTPTKLHISDANFNLTYALADMLLIDKVPTVNEPEEWDVDINLDKDHINNLIKAKSALAEIDNMLVTTEEDLNDNIVCKFTFGDEQGHNNKITYHLEGQIDIEDLKLPFNSDIFTNVLKTNKNPDVGELKINSRGLMKLKFVHGDIVSEYFLVRKEDTNF